jgi:hypothetical protein
MARSFEPARCLEKMGPLFALFGRYLATRIDLLPESLCEELARIPDRADSLRAATVREIFIRELGRAPECIFSDFCFEPLESRLLWQAHAARLAGATVVIRIIHAQPWISDADHLPLLAAPFAEHGVDRARFAHAVADFRTHLTAAGNFEGDLRAAALLQQDAKSFGTLAAPAIHEHLCRPSLMVCEPYRSITEAAPDPDLARSLCFTWLRQSLHGFVYPVEPTAANVTLTSESHIRFTAGPFATLPDATKRHLWEYLIAMASDDIDSAYCSLAHEIGDDSSNANSQLRRRFRHMVAFRDGFRTAYAGAAPRLGQSRLLSEEVLVHWRLASEHGRIDGGLISFYRGLFTVVRTAAQLAPGRDSLSEALADLRLETLFGTAKDMFQPSQVAGWLEQYATAMVGMPTRLERALGQMSADDAPDSDRSERMAETWSGHRLVIAASLLLAMAGVMILLSRIAPGNQIAVLMFFGLGCLWLRIGSHLC